MAEPQQTIQAPKFIIQGSYIAGILLAFLGLFLLYSYFFHSLLPTNNSEVIYALTIITTAIVGLFLYKKALIYDDRIVIHYPLLRIKREFDFNEISKIHIESRFTVRLISMQFTKPVLLVKFSNFSGSHYFNDIATFLKDRNVNVIYKRDA